MPVGHPGVNTEQTGENTWIAECDGFEAMGATESEAIDAVFLKIQKFWRETLETMKTEK